MEFWNSLLTKKSQDVLLDLKKKPFGFILIGGWAAYLWAKLHKSKDIDIVLPDISDIEYLKKNYNLKKNENLRKYEIQIEEVDIDIYTPFYSKLAIPVEDISRYTTRIEGIDTVIPEALLILKQGAFLDRKMSVKGEKDKIDIMTLLFYTSIDFDKYRLLLANYQIKNYIKELIKTVSGFRDIGHLNMNPRQFKVRKQEILRLIEKE